MEAAVDQRPLVFSEVKWLFLSKESGFGESMDKFPVGGVCLEAWIGFAVVERGPL